MSKQNDGGLAFPAVVDEETSYCIHGGMSLRAWMAGQVDVPWEIAHEAARIILRRRIGTDSPPSNQQVINARAGLRVLEADAIIAELEK